MIRAGRRMNRQKRNSQSLKGGVSVNEHDSNEDKVEVLRVGGTVMTVPDSKDIEALRRIKRYLYKDKIPADDPDGIEEMIMRLEYVINILLTCRASYESCESDTITIKNIINDTGFISFKEYLATDSSVRECEAFNLFVKSAINDKEFPDNIDSSWKSYRAILRHVLDSDYSFTHYDCAVLYREYQRILNDYQLVKEASM